MDFKLQLVLLIVRDLVKYICGKGSPSRNVMNKEHTVNQ